MIHVTRSTWHLNKNESTTAGMIEVLENYSDMFPKRMMTRHSHWSFSVVASAVRESKERNEQD